jgi:hypothetical protein
MLLHIRLPGCDYSMPVFTVGSYKGLSFAADTAWYCDHTKVFLTGEGIVHVNLT